MLTQLHIRNFKAWKDTGAIRLAPLTVIFGANSAGKSSLGQLLLALQQTARSTDRKRTLQLGGAGSRIDLGSFTDCLHNHNTAEPLAFALDWTLPAPLAVHDPLSTAPTLHGSAMALAVELLANSRAQPQVDRLRYGLSNAAGDVLDATLIAQADQSYALHSSNYSLRPTGLPLQTGQAVEKFYRLSETLLASYRNAGFLADFALATEAMLNSLCYLGPVRHLPQRMYSWSGDVPDDVGSVGENTIAAILAAQDDGRRLSRSAEAPPQTFAEFIAAWLKDLGVIHDFAVRSLAQGRTEYEVLVKTHANAPEVKITDVGFGVSQMLPALVQAFYCAPHSIVWMEQPEIHLHPQVQAEFADVFISAIQSYENGQPRQVQLVVESHSEHFLNRLQRRVAEGVVRPEDVAVYFCRRENDAAALEPLRLNRYGEIENWPEHFFGDEMADIAGRTLAALQQKRQQDTP